MNEQEVLRVLARVGAIIVDSHIVYTSGKHGATYVNKDALYAYPIRTSDMCLAIAEQFNCAHTGLLNGVEVVIGPAIGGAILSQVVAYHLTHLNGWKVCATYAERSESLLLEANKEPLNFVGICFPISQLMVGQELVVKSNYFVIKRGYDKLIAGKRVLVVEDVLTNGGSAKKVVEATRAAGGNVVGLGVLVNRGGITPQDVADVPKLTALVNMPLDAYDEAICPLCKQNVPINTDVGKGREFLSRKQK